jgi:hypothetical protein
MGKIVKTPDLINWTFDEIVPILPETLTERAFQTKSALK